jgi:hypothetical protein
VFTPAEVSVEVYATDDEAIAQLLCSHLIVRGIHAKTSKKQAVPEEGRRPIKGVHRIVVWSGDEGQASMILATLMEESEEEKQLR